MVKLRGKLRSVLALAMAVIMLVTMAMPTFAAGTASVGSVAGDINGGTIVGQDVDQGKQTEYKNDITVGDTALEEECDVYATVPNSGIVVTVPKVQILNGKAGVSNTGIYQVEVRGDISAETVITVSPLDEMADREGVNFEMSSAGKNNIPTDVEQERTAFTYADGVRPDSPATTTGVITAYGMTAGIWNGDFQFNIGAATRSLNADELEERYDLLYYSALHKAVTDVNNDAIGENTDVPKEQAVAAVYTDENGATNVMLLKDSTEDVTSTPNVDMTINLAGNTLSVNAAKAIEVTGGDITIDGRTEGSSIEMDYDNNKSRCISASGGSLTVNGGTYINNSSDAANTFAIYSTVESLINNVVVKTNNASGTNGGIYASNKVTISDCSVTVNNGSSGYGIFCLGEANISNCNIDVKGTVKNACDIYTNSVATISNCNLNTKGTVQAFAIVDYGTVNISNSNIDAYCTGSGAKGIQCETNCKLFVSNCDINVDSSYVSSDSPLYSHASTGIVVKGYAEVSDTFILATGAGSYSSYGISTNNGSTLYLNNCNVKGLHSGVGGTGTLYVDGGTYEGYAHGGFYFSGTDTVSYVENANIKQCDWYGNYEKPADNTVHHSGFYIGTNPNVTVYMNNCDIWTYIKGFTFRSGNGEANNVLYISNSEIKSLYPNVYGEKGDTCIRIDAVNPNNKLFIGKGCNFTVDDVAYDGDTSGVTSTNEVYTRP